MSIQLNISNYNGLVSSIHDLLSSGQYKAVTMTVFDDAQHSTITNDSNGLPIHNRTIASTTNTSEYKDSNGNTVYGTVVLNFCDGTIFVCKEVIQAHWYSLDGISILHR